MRITRRVREILSWYESDNPGTKASLARILMHGRLGGSGRVVILPVDQGFEHGPARSFAPNPPAYDPHYHWRLAIDAGLNAFASPLGMIESGAASFAGAIPTILKLNSANSLGAAKDQAVTGSVRDALRLGCSAIGFTIYPASDRQYEMIEEIRELAAEAKAHGLAVVVWSYPRGGGLSREGETALDVVAYAAHMAALAGAHIVKVKPPTAHLEQEAAARVYRDAGIDADTLETAHRPHHAGRLRRPPAGGLLRRRGQGAGGALRRGPRHPRGRRQRLDHRPQQLPAPARRRARHAGHGHRHLPRQGVEALFQTCSFPSSAGRSLRSLGLRAYRAYPRDATRLRRAGAVARPGLRPGSAHLSHRFSRRVRVCSYPAPAAQAPQNRPSGI